MTYYHADFDRFLVYPFGLVSHFIWDLKLKLGLVQRLLLGLGQATPDWFLGHRVDQYPGYSYLRIASSIHINFK